MHCVKSFLAGLLITSTALGGLPARAGESSFMLMRSTLVEVQQSGGAVEEREQGRSLLHRGKAADALVHLERALKAFQAAGDKPGEASTRDLMGELYERQGRYDIALQNYEAAYQIYSAMAVSEGQQGALAASLSTQEGTYNANLMLAKIGQMQYRRGDAGAARAAFSRMRVTKPETNQLKNAQSTKSNTESGAKKIIGFGSRIRGAASGRPSTSTPGAVTGVVTDTAGTLKQPFNSYRETIIYATYELGMGRVEYLNNQLDTAKTHFNNVLAATSGSLGFIGNLGQTRRYRTAARTSLGDVAFRQGRYADAAKLYNDAAKGARDDGRLDLMWPAQRGTGRSLWYQAAAEKDQKKAAKLREDALTSYRQALDTIEALREGSLRADEARASFLATTGDVFDEAAGALAEMALAAQSNSVPGASNAPATSAPLDGKALAYASEALSVVERGRSRSLLDMLNEAGAEITEGVPADLLQKKRDNQKRQQEIAAQLSGLNLGEKPTKSVEELEKELNQLQNDYDDIENQIRSASPRYAALTAPKPLAVEDIRQQVLDDQTALLEYKLGDERSYLFAVTRTGFTLSRLPSRDEIERQAIALREQIIPASARRSITDMVSATPNAQRGLTVSGGGATTGDPAAVSAFAQASNALYKTCVEPAAPLFKQSRLLIVADGALSYIPFHALVTSAPASGADFSTLPYLLKTNDTLFAPSASVVAAIRQQRAAASQGGGMLIVADPVFDASDARARGAKTAAAPDSQAEAARGLSFDSALADVSSGDTGKATTGAGPQRGVLIRLSGTRTEAQQIARLATVSGQKADVWLDLEANESNVEERNLQQYRVLHFATHGLLNTERPQFTGVVLSLVGNKPGTDGFLRTDEVFNLHLGSPLVMLSACETGLGKEKRGEGVMGLARAFMYAGAPAVGVSLWSVADRSTAELMADFYKNLLGGAGKTPSAAMRTARLDMINGKRYSAPFYWAPFVLVGDWK